MDSQEKICQLALSLIKGVGFNIWKKLIQEFTSAQQVFSTSPNALKNVLKSNSQQIIQAILQKETCETAKVIIQSHASKNIRVLSFFEDAYPQRLKHIANPPSFLYAQGNFNLENPKIISIVGTRNATAYGKNFLEKLIEEMVSYKVLVVSGLAYGIDIHTHKLALKYGLSTVGILASGLDIIYPGTHKKIAIEMLENGGLITESPIGTKLESFQFPNRNRIIAGLADATIVIEADFKSGAIITANFANDYNREVFAVPGNIYERYSAGCNHLIKTQQAHLVTKWEDILYIMRWQENKQSVLQSPSYKILNFLGYSQEEQQVIKALQFFDRAIHIDALSEKSLLPLNKLSPILLQLELNNIVQLLPGNKFKLISL